MTNQQFIETIAPIVQREAQARGYKYPSAIIAQACLESNFGRSKLSADYHNYFGLKCGSSWTGGCVNLKTKEEYKPGEKTTIRDNFRTYADMSEGVAGYFSFIQASRYKWLKAAVSPFDYLVMIKEAGYCTSGTYPTDCFALIKRYDLEKYDVPEQQTPAKGIEAVARDVLAGKYGNGAARKIKLTRAGYSYAEVQAEVNRLLRG